MKRLRGGLKPVGLNAARLSAFYVRGLGASRVLRLHLGVLVTILRTLAPKSRIACLPNTSRAGLSPDAA